MRIIFNGNGIFRDFVFFLLRRCQVSSFFLLVSICERSLAHSYWQMLKLFYLNNFLVFLPSNFFMTFVKYKLLFSLFSSESHSNLSPSIFCFISISWVSGFKWFLLLLKIMFWVLKPLSTSAVWTGKTIANCASFIKLNLHQRQRKANSLSLLAHLDLYLRSTLFFFRNSNRPTCPFSAFNFFFGAILFKKDRSSDG